MRQNLKAWQYTQYFCCLPHSSCRRQAVRNVRKDARTFLQETACLAASRLFQSIVRRFQLPMRETL